MNFKDFVASKPKLKYIFFGGKGGVGKTAVAAGAAYYFSEHLGRKTLIYSMNLTHSLSSTFSQDLFGKGLSKIEGTKRLYATEVDISDATSRYEQKIRNNIITYIKGSGVPFLPELFSEVDRSIDRFVDVMTSNPVFEEFLIFNDMVGVFLQDEFDVYILDTAPVAFTYRIFKMSKVYDFWLRKMDRERKEAGMKASPKELALEKVSRDPLLMSLFETREKAEEGRKLLNDPEKTAFFFVTLPLALPIAVTEKFVRWLQDLNIPVGGVIVNEIIPRDHVLPDVSPYIYNKVREQERYLKVILKRFPSLISAHVPLYETEVRGIGMIAKVAEAIE